MDYNSIKIEAKRVPKIEGSYHDKERFDDAECKNKWEENKEKIIEMINENINDLFNDPMVCGYDEDYYPRRDVVTGEWYIGDVDVFYDDNKEFTFLIEACCLGQTDTDKEDYYGIYNWFSFDSEGKLIFDSYDSFAM